MGLPPVGATGHGGSGSSSGGAVVTCQSATGRPVPNRSIGWPRADWDPHPERGSVPADPVRGSLPVRRRDPAPGCQGVTGVRDLSGSGFRVSAAGRDRGWRQGYRHPCSRHLAVGPGSDGVQDGEWAWIRMGRSWDCREVVRASRLGSSEALAVRSSGPGAATGTAPAGWWFYRRGRGAGHDWGGRRLGRRAHLWCGCGHS
jgi:hypothetical protein